MCTYFGEVLFIFNKSFLFWDIIDQDGVCAYFNKGSSTKFLEQGDVFFTTVDKVQKSILDTTVERLARLVVHFFGGLTPRLQQSDLQE